jgi:hypothetical protein
MASKKVRKVENGEETYPSMHKDNFRYLQSTNTYLPKDLQEPNQPVFKEDHLAKKSIIITSFYVESENLLALSLIHKELKFYLLQVSPKTNTFDPTPLPDMTY